MMRLFYVIYNARAPSGSAVGRCYVETNLPLDTVDRISEIEAAVLADVQSTAPELSNLFLTWWTELPYVPSFHSRVDARVVISPDPTKD